MFSGLVSRPEGMRFLWLQEQIPGSKAKSEWLWRGTFCQPQGNSGKSSDDSIAILGDSSQDWGPDQVVERAL